MVLIMKSVFCAQGLVQRNTSSVEEISFNLEPAVGFRGSVKIPLYGSIGLEVTPPEEGQDSSESLNLQGTIV